jgi:hypothetical protein
MSSKKHQQCYVSKSDDCMPAGRMFPIWMTSWWHVFIWHSMIHDVLWIEKCDSSMFSYCRRVENHTNTVENGHFKAFAAADISVEENMEEKYCSNQYCGQMSTLSISCVKIEKSKLYDPEKRLVERKCYFRRKSGKLWWFLFVDCQKLHVWLLNVKRKLHLHFCRGCWTRNTMLVRHSFLKWTLVSSILNDSSSKNEHSTDCLSSLCNNYTSVSHSTFIVRYEIIWWKIVSFYWDSAKNGRSIYPLFIQV